MNIRPSIILLVGTAMTAVFLGTLGFHQLGSENGWATSPNWLTSFYLAVQLFTLNSGGVQGEIPPFLELARWMAPIATLGGFFALASTYIARFRDWVRLTFLIGEHTIICGAGEKGAAIAFDQLDSIEGKKGVVVIESDPDVPSLQSLRQSGALVVIGDARSPDVLASAGLDRASGLVAVAGTDECNLAIALVTAKTVSLERSSDPLSVFTHVANLSLRDVLQRNRVLDMTSEKQHRIRLFNYFRNRARLILDRYPLEMDNAGKLRNEPHLIIPAMDRQELALMIHAALVGHYSDGGCVTIHLVSSSATADQGELLRYYPNFSRCARLEVHNLNTDSAFDEEVVSILKGMGEGGFATVYLGSREEEGALTTSLLIREKLPNCSTMCRVLFSEREGGVIRKVLTDKPDELTEALGIWLKITPPTVEACGRDSVFAQKLDDVARKIHEVWYKQNSGKISKAQKEKNMEEAKKLASKPAYKEWDDLTEEQKDANRFAADHLKIKVRSLGLDPGSTGLAEQWAELDEEQIELLSRMEHERWSAPLWISGWNTGVKRDEMNRLHPDLIPYDDLSEGTKGYDRDQVKAVAEYLKQ
jgi:hypothetical protein